LKRRLKKNEYRCAGCHKVYEKGWSDEEAAEEWNRDFPGQPIDKDTSLICDICYEAINKDMKDNPWKYEGLDH
jgi:hypothetical protein